MFPEFLREKIGNTGISSETTIPEISSETTIREIICSGHLVTNFCCLAGAQPVFPQEPGSKSSFLSFTLTQNTCDAPCLAVLQIDNV